MSNHPARYHAVAHKLTTLSPEIVHKILDDLPLIKILELICAHDIPYLDACVLSHFQLGKLVDSPEALCKLKQYFNIYMETCQCRQGRRDDGHPDIPALRKDVVAFVSQKLEGSSSHYNALLMDVRLAIRSRLEVYARYIPALSRFSKEPIPQRPLWMSLAMKPVSLRQLWENIDGAERNLRAVKVEQLRTLARLILEYRGMLRCCEDTSQEPRRSLEHRADTFEMAAKKMLKPQVKKKIFGGDNLFAEHKFPLVPYNRYLRCFVKVLERYPYDEAASLADGKRPRPKLYVYSSEVAANIATAVKGLEYVYTRDSVKTDVKYTLIPRTRYTIYSEEFYRAPTGQRQPKFLDRSLIDPYDGDSRIRNDNDKVLPLAEKEFEWLEAFLKSCKFMEQMDVEWSAKMTVRQFWNKHIGIGPGPAPIGVVVD